MLSGLAVKASAGGSPAEGLAWSGVEGGVGDRGDVICVPAGQVGAFREVLAQRTMGSSLVPRCHGLFRSAKYIVPGALYLPDIRRAASPEFSDAFLDISPDSSAILRIFLPILFAHKVFLPQYLTVKQPGSGDKVDQWNPVGKYQELADQDETKADINRIAAHREYARRDELIGVVDVDVNAETRAEGD